MLPTHANQTYTYTHSCWMQWKGKWKGGTWQKVLGVIFVVFYTSCWSFPVCGFGQSLYNAWTCPRKSVCQNVLSCLLRWHSSLSAEVTKNANLGYSHDQSLS